MLLIRLFIRFFPLLLILAGVGLIFYTIGLGILSMILDTIVGKLMRLVPNSLVYNMWRTLPVPIYIQFTFFNVTNADKLSQGEKPILKEMGPYVYLEDLEKVDMTQNEENDTVRYRQTRDYYFQRSMSYGPDSDKITFINLVFLGVTTLAHQHIDADFLLEMLDEKLTEKGEMLYKTATVKEIAFDGFPINAYTELLEDDVVKAATEDIDLKIPPQYADGLFALLKGRNGTDDGWWEVKRGIRDSSEFAQIVSYNGQRSLNVWKGDSCNALNGTDGTIYPPFMERDRKVQVFVPLICRSVTLNYETNVLSSFIPSGRYVGLSNDFLSVPSNPDNWCYCPKDDVNNCDIDGIFHIDLCQGVPGLVTKPHFMDVRSNRIRTSVEGLSPNRELHEAYIDFHMRTGAPIAAHMRLQLNFELTPSISMPSLENVATATVPFVFVEEGGGLDLLNKFGLMLLSLNLFFWDYFKWIMPILGLAEVLIGVALAKRRNDMDKVMTIDLNNEKMNQKEGSND